MIICMNENNNIRWSRKIHKTYICNIFPNVIVALICDYSYFWDNVAKSIGLGVSYSISCINILLSGQIIIGTHYITIKMLNPDTTISHQFTCLTGKSESTANCFSHLHDGRIIGGFSDNKLKILDPTSMILEYTGIRYAGIIKCTTTFIKWYTYQWFIRWCY